MLFSFLQNLMLSWPLVSREYLPIVLGESAYGDLGEIKEKMQICWHIDISKHKMCWLIEMSKFNFFAHWYFREHRHKLRPNCQPLGAQRVCNCSLQVSTLENVFWNKRERNISLSLCLKYLRCYRFGHSQVLRVFQGVRRWALEFFFFE